ncbi:MAG TPA: vitamin B12-dependent ribonucleotide reductase, partial [Pirellulaceae bacterium]|nr:vitamin B12-dependent ribonucleotide reductase [Pirellulaceae bacterium]
DYIFRWLGITFLPGYREANKGMPPIGKEKDASEAKEAEAKSPVNGNGAAVAPSPNGQATSAGTRVIDLDSLDRAGVAMKVDAKAKPASRDSQFARFQSDAPSCDNCGSITVRNGNCYLCHNCGNSMGCS